MQETGSEENNVLPMGQKVAPEQLDVPAAESNGGPETSDETPTQEASPEPEQQVKQVPLNMVKGFVCLKVKSLAEAAGMLNAMATTPKGKKRHVVIHETIPQMNPGDMQMMIHMLVEAK